jgi:NAD(P)H-flavin reductase
MGQFYAIFGVIAMFMLTLMLLLSTKTAIRWLGYEFFKITHWFLAVLYIGACWGHWDRLWCWMVPSLALMCIDQIIRIFRTCFVHSKNGGGLGFKCAQAEVTIIGADDDLVVRLDFEHEHRERWRAGQHFYLCFPSLSIWQSHPFTPSSIPSPKKGLQRHTYIIRVRDGLTRRLAALPSRSPVPVILVGPYGNAYPANETPNVLCVAGGTGISFSLPIVHKALQQPVVPQAAVQLTWIVRKADVILWLGAEIAELKRLVDRTPSLRVQIFATRESEHRSNVKMEKKSDEVESQSESPLVGPDLDNLLADGHERFSVTCLRDHHPSMLEVVNSFVGRSESVGGNVAIVGSGPEEMGADLRSAVAAIPTKEHVDFYWDSRK